jgi:CBS domain-containing protein
MVELYVDQVMSRPARTVAPTASLRVAAGEMLAHDVGALVVEGADGVGGVLTTTDLVGFVAGETPAEDATVAEHARTDVVTTERRAPVAEVVAAMRDRRIHHVPVVDGDEVVGMVSTFDLAVWLGRTLEA